MQQVDSRTQRRGRGIAALPQFDLHASDSFDPDRTLERLPALSAPKAAHPDVRPTREPDADMASTVEIIPEVSALDIIESRPAPRKLPPLHLPAPVSVPIDLDRLLAQAHAKTSRSRDFFRPAKMTAGPTSDRDEPTPVPTILPVGSAKLLVAPPKRRAPFAWAFAAVTVAAVLAIGVSVGHSGVSSASSSKVAAQPAMHVVATPAVAQPAAPDPVVAASASDIPAVSVQSLPRVESGTISLAAVAASHRLFIDGKLAPRGSATVSCGHHVVQVGSRGARRRVDVPCGQEVVLAN